MTANTKRVWLAAGALVALLAVGLIIAQAGGDGDDPTGITSPSVSAPPADSTLPPSSPKQEVKDAYLRQWDVYTEAVRNLKTDALNEVFTGKALEIVRKEIQRRRRDQTPVAIRVKHDFGIKLVDASTAVVDDRYVNRTTDIDPDTGKPTKRYRPDLIQELYTLKKVEGIWKVSAIFRQSIEPAKR